MGRVGVKQADPEFAGQVVQPAQQRAQRGGLGRQRPRRGRELLRRRDVPAVLRTQIQPVIGRILGDEIQLLHPVRQEFPGLSQDVGLGPAPMAPPHARDDAETARMIAALGNLDVGKMFGRQPEAGRDIIRDIAGPKVDLDDRLAGRP